MNCPREQLPLLLYGDLPAGEVETLNRHVAECANCREELVSLRAVREALNSTPMPEVVVDPAQIFLASSAPLPRKRWLPRAISGALAASLLALAILNLEVRVDQQQLVVRWGAPPVAPVAQIVNPPQTDSRAIASLEERVKLLQELTHALARDADRRDRLRTDDIIRTKAQIDALTQSSGQQLVETRRDVDALYAAHFKSSEPGAKP